MNGVSLAMGDWGDGNPMETAQIIVDGSAINLNDWMSDGRITINGDQVTGGGSSATDANGRFVGYETGNNVGSTTQLITFNIPVTSVGVQRLTGWDTAKANIDVLIERTASHPPCFTTGTLIDTDHGQVAVEDLKAGDMIRTMDHGFQPVKWVGESRVYASGFDTPVRIKAGTFNNTRDLVVSPRHKMLMNHTHLSLMLDVAEGFACAMHLRNDDTIVQEAEGWVNYYHILLDRHEVIFAEGAATESFYPDQGTLDGMASKTREALLENFTPETYGPQARPTLTAMQSMWIAQNLDTLKGDDMGQIAAFEAAQAAE